MKRTEIEVNGMAVVKVEMTAEEYAMEFDDMRDADNIIWLEDEYEVPSDMFVEEVDGMFTAIYSGRGVYDTYSTLEEALEVVARYM